MILSRASNKIRRHPNFIKFQDNRRAVKLASHSLERDPFLESNTLEVPLRNLSR